MAGYRVFVNGSRSGETSSTSYLVRGLRCATTVTLDVQAYDAAGNLSSRPSVSVVNCRLFGSRSVCGNGDGVDSLNTASTTGTVIDSFDDTVDAVGEGT